MLKVESNVAKVLRQTEAYRAEVPKAVARALQPQKWLERAREVATAAALASPLSVEEKKMVPELVKRVMAGPLALGPGFYIELDARQRGRELFATQESFLTADFQGFDTARVISLVGLTPGGLETLLLEWVNTPESEGGKRLDERDAGKSDVDIVAGLMEILFTPFSSEAVDTARAGLMPHLTAFFQKAMAEQGEITFDPDRLDVVLRAILAAWRMMVLDEVTIRIRKELKVKKFP